MGATWSRRSFLSWAAWGSAVSALPARTVAGEPGPSGLIVRSRHPLDLETPVAVLDGRVTPNDLFFVRSHLGVPAVAPGPWHLVVGGMVDRPFRSTVEGLGGFARTTVPAVLQCSGNGRAYFRPRLPGVNWDRGAVGNAEWSGVRLADVLNRAGLKPGAAHVHFLGADGPPSPRTPAFLRSLPLEKALHPDTLLAVAMNGEPLPGLHGGPVRLVVPGWAGNHWMKWVRTVTVADAEAPGFYMQTGYRMPKTPAPPDAVLKPADLVPLTTLNVKSLITRPADGSRLPAGRLEVRGVAWTGEAQVTGVEVAVGPEGQARWEAAELVGEPTPWGWRQWTYTRVPSGPGPTLVRARATDSRGETQPESTPWNRSGYLWNGIDRISCEIG